MRQPLSISILFIAQCIFTLCMLAMAISTASAAERPNILFFFVDDLGKYASIYADSDKPSPAS